LQLLPEGFVDNAAAHPTLHEAFQLRLHIFIKYDIHLGRHKASLLQVENNMAYHNYVSDFEAKVLHSSRTGGPGKRAERDPAAGLRSAI
jgi:hypothetical protein